MTSINLGFVSNIQYRPAQDGYAGQKEKKAYASAYYRFDGNPCTLKAFGRQADQLGEIAQRLERQDFGEGNKPVVGLYVEGRIKVEDVEKDGEKRRVTYLIAHKMTPVTIGDAAIETAALAQQIYAANRARRGHSDMDGSGSWQRSAPAPMSAPPQQAAAPAPTQYAPAPQAMPPGVQQVNGMQFGGGPWSTQMAPPPGAQDAPPF